jgi:hypothetical protein
MSGSSFPRIGFDGKEFSRKKKVYAPVQGQGLKIHYETGFYTPLGVGVSVSKNKEFDQSWLQETKRLASDFMVQEIRPLYSSYDLKEDLGLKRAIPFCDQLVQSVQKFIDSIFVSYVVLPTDKVPTVRVGGYKCPEEEIPTPDFLRNLGPMFSYITAWAYFGLPREVSSVNIDGFVSKWTPAWSDLLKVHGLGVFPHGDECNVLINAADIIAFLTDAKLYASFKKLLPDEIKSVWKDYAFKTDVRFLDASIASKYTWKSQEHIDVTPHLARPMTFLMIDQIEKLAHGPAGEEALEEQPKFREMLRKMEPWSAAVTYALERGGGVQSYGGTVDAKKVKDGDTLVYVGGDSRKAAEALGDIYDVEVLSAKELRKKVEKKT